MAFEYRNTALLLIALGFGLMCQTRRAPRAPVPHDQVTLRPESPQESPRASRETLMTPLPADHLREWHGLTCSQHGCTSRDAPEPLALFFDLPCTALQSTGIVNARCEGAKGDGTTDDTTVLRGLLEARKGSRVVLLPPGTYIISEPLRLPGRRKLLGAGAETIVAVANDVSEPLAAVIYTRGPNEVLDLSIDARGRARRGLHFFKNHAIGGQIRGVSVKNALDDGFFCDFSMSSALDRVVARNNGGDGFQFNSCNAELVLGLVSTGNGGHGVHVTGAPSTVGNSASGGVHLVGGVVKNNRGDGVVVSGTTSFTVVEDFEIESDGDGIRVTGAAKLWALRGNRVRPGAAASDQGRAIRVDGDSYNGFILGNTFVDDNNPSRNFPVIELHDSVSQSYVVGNKVETTTARVPAEVRYQNRNMVVFENYHSFLESPLVWSDPGLGKMRGLGFSDEPPRAGQWHEGDIVISTKANQQSVGWICTQTQSGTCRWASLSIPDMQPEHVVSPLLLNKGVGRSSPVPPTTPDSLPLDNRAGASQNDADGEPSARATENDACRALEAVGVVSVTCHGAAADGSEDSTAAFEDALAAARPDKTVYVPPGDYILSSTLDVTGTSIFGAGFQSRLFASDSPDKPLRAVLASDGDATRIERLGVHAAHHADHAIVVTDSKLHPTLIRRVTMGSSLRAALRLTRVAVATVNGVGTYKSGAGFLIEEPLAVRLQGLHSHQHAHSGLVVRRDANQPLDPRHGAVGAHVFHADLSRNGDTPVVLERMTRPAIAEYLWLENPGTGVRLDAVHNSTLRYARAVGHAGDHHAFVLTGGSSNNLLEANAANYARTGYSDEEHARSNSIFVAPGCVGNRLIGNVFASNQLRLPLSVQAVDRTIRTSGTVAYKGGGKSRGFMTYRRSPPAIAGRWQPGDLILSPDPGPQDPAGWVCVSRAPQPSCSWEAITGTVFDP